MAAGNPFWDIHNAIWSKLEARNDFTSAVRSTNRIKHVASAQDAIAHRESLTGDYVPEVVVVQAGMQVADRIAANDTEVKLQWEVWITSGDQRFDSFFNVQFAVLRALLNWDSLMTDLTWESTNYVKNCELLDTKDSLINTDLNRGIKGWSSVWRGETWCVFAHNLLIA